MDWPRRLPMQHVVQREIGRFLAPIWIPIAVLVMRVGMGYRIHDMAAVRAKYARIREASSGPLLICANHLTMVDSPLVAWALTPTCLWGWLRPAAEPRVDRYGLGQASEEAMLTSGGTSLTLSPDGSRLVYVGPGDEGGGALWLKERDELRARRIPGTEGALMPFFDPGGERVGFFGPDASSGQSVNAVSLESGQVITFESTLSFRRGASWGRDGIYLAGDLRHLIRLSETLDPLEPVTELGSGEAGHVYPDEHRRQHRGQYRRRKPVCLFVDY